MKSWDRETLDKLQQEEMGILAELDRICTEYGIPYYLAAGSCLGAIRHAGMIPWDDDIDLFLHREDYERLLAVLPEALSSAYFLQTMDTDPEYMYPFAKIRKNDTSFVQEALRDIPMHHGIYIDLFPVDGAPQGGMARQRHRFWLFFYKRVSIGHILPRRIERIAYGFLYVFCSRKKLLRKYDRYCRRYDSRKTGWCQTGTSDYAYRRELVPRESYGEGRRVPFGALTLPVPDDAETCLTIMYGDWETPPPEAERLSQHAPWIIDFDKEYKPIKKKETDQV